MADTRATQPAPAPQTETITISGADTSVPAGTIVSAIALSDSSTQELSLGSAPTQANGNYTITTTVPVASLSFATFIDVTDSTQNAIVVGFGGSTPPIGGLSATETTTLNTPPPPSGGLKTDLQTLIKDFLDRAGTSQLKADLTAVLSDIKNHNFGGADPGSTTFAAVSFIDHLPASVIAGSHS